MILIKWSVFPFSVKFGGVLANPLPPTEGFGYPANRRLYLTSPEFFEKNLFVFRWTCFLIPGVPGAQNEGFPFSKPVCFIVWISIAADETFFLEHGGQRTLPWFYLEMTSGICMKDFQSLCIVIQEEICSFFPKKTLTEQVPIENMWKYLNVLWI